MLQTRFNVLLEIEAPVQLAGMPGVCTVELAAAVANAGGLGMLSAAHLTPEFLSSTSGDIDALALYASESTFAVGKVQDAGEIVREMTTDASLILSEKG
jgi:NAD(P)H-dependent flavin oxidoreductase YrpB (nitropropane dioxygenase family)